MNKKEFLENTNRSPLFNEYRNRHDNITEKFLKEMNFLKKDYVLQDLVILSNLIKKSYLPVASTGQIQRNHKDFQHYELIKRTYNRQVILDWRGKLNIPISGFTKKNQHHRWLNSSASTYKFTNKNGKTGTADFCRIHYTDNIRKGHIADEKISNEEIIDIAINDIIKRWKLPIRYEPAVASLLLFNKIIPANNEANLFILEEGWGSKKSGVISFGTDTTGKEINKIIAHPSFKKIKKQLPGKNKSTPRKEEETTKIIEKYNKLKNDGYKDKEIYPVIANNLHYKISISAIKKRIKGD